VRKAVITISFLLICQILIAQRFFDSSVYGDYYRIKNYVPKRSSVLDSMENYFENYQITNFKSKKSIDPNETFSLIDNYLVKVNESTKNNNDNKDTTSEYWKFIKEVNAFRDKRNFFDSSSAIALDKKIAGISSPLDKINAIFYSFDVLNTLTDSNSNWTFEEPYWQVIKYANSQSDTDLKIKCLQLIGDYYAKTLDFTSAISAYLDEEEYCISDIQKANVELKIGKLFDVDVIYNHGYEFEYENESISVVHLGNAAYYYASAGDSLSYYSTELLRLSVFLIKGGISDSKNEPTLIFAKSAIDFAKRRNITDNHFYFSLFYLLGKYFEIKREYEFNETSEYNTTSIEYYREALNFAIDDGDFNSIVKVLNRISSQYFLSKDSINAIKYLDEIIKINSKIDFLDKYISYLEKSDLLLKLNKVEEGYHLLGSSLKAIDSLSYSFHWSHFYRYIYNANKLHLSSMLRNRDSIDHYKEMKEFSMSTLASDINEIHGYEYDFTNLQNQRVVDDQADKLMNIQKLMTLQDAILNNRMKEVKYYTNFVSELSDTISLFHLYCNCLCSRYLISLSRRLD